MVGDHNASGEASKMGSWVWNVFPTVDEQAADFFLTKSRQPSGFKGDKPEQSVGGIRKHIVYGILSFFGRRFTRS